MSTAIFLPLAVVFATAVFALVWVMVRTVARFQGKMLVTCPETDEAVGVEVDVKNAALRAAVGDRVGRLSMSLVRDRAGRRSMSGCRPRRLPKG